MSQNLSENLIFSGIIITENDAGLDALTWKGIREMNPKKTSLAKKAGKTFLTAIVLVVLFFGWASINGFQKTPPPIEPENGCIDLTGIDLDKELITMGAHWDFYPNRLLYSDDFKSGAVTEDMKEAIRDDAPYGTYRVLLRGIPGSYYLVDGYSIDYGTRVYVNGSKTLEIGTVGTSAEDSVGCVNYMTFPLSIRDDGYCEVIIQFSNYVGNDGGVIHQMQLSSPENIRNRQEHAKLASSIVSAGLLLLGAYYLLLACITLDAQAFWLAASCLLLSIRDTRFFIGQMLPLNYNWAFHYRVAVLDLLLIAFAILRMMESFYPKLTNRWVRRVFSGYVAVASIFILTVPVQRCSGISRYSAYVVAAYLIYFVVCLFWHFWKNRKLENADKLTLTGFSILVVANVAETSKLQIEDYATRVGFSSFAMIAFIMIMMAVLAMKEQEAQNKLVENRKHMEMLEQMDHMKTEFLRDMAHEVKTPLTIASGYAQRTKRRLQRGIVDEEDISNLELIQAESERLADIVTQMLHLPLGQGRGVSMVAVPVQTLMLDISALCRPMFLKNHNTLELTYEQNLRVFASHDMLLQVLLNLATNANRHTSGGTIRFDVRKNGCNMAEFRISDTGHGIPKELLKPVFEKSFSYRGEHGRGLPIAKEIVEGFGGAIEIEKTDSTGTTVLFTVPLYGEENADGDNTVGGR